MCIWSFVCRGPKNSSFVTNQIVVPAGFFSMSEKYAYREKFCWPTLTWRTFDMPLPFKVARTVTATNRVGLPVFESSGSSHEVTVPLP